MIERFSPTKFLGQPPNITLVNQVFLRYKSRISFDNYFTKKTPAFLQYRYKKAGEVEERAIIFTKGLPSYLQIYSEESTGRMNHSIPEVRNSQIIQYCT